MKSLSAVPIRLAQSLRSFDYIWRSLRRSRQGTIGLLIVIVHMFIAVASPYIVPYSPMILTARTGWRRLPSNIHLAPIPSVATSLRESC